MEKIAVILFCVICSANALANQDYHKFDKEKALKKLTPLQYRVTQNNATEPAFKNQYWNNKDPGIYVDVVSGQPLFSSTHKYDSKTGWPSFYRPIDPKNLILTKEWHLFFGTRLEVKSTMSKSHLGHVFNDGPLPTHKRYCINSAALKFIPKDKMKQEGYGDLLYLFNK